MRALTIDGVADTHTAVWFLNKDERLSSRARRHIEAAAARQHKIAVSSITLVEIVYLVEKKRLPETAYEELNAALTNPFHVFTEAVLDVHVVAAMRQVARSEVPDMPDRIVAATAVHLDVAVISRDAQIRSSAIRTIW